MRRGSVHRFLLPTMWGYATLTRRTHPALPDGGGMRRVDTVLPPVLTPDELTDLHGQLLPFPGFRGRVLRTAPSSPCLRRVLDLAIDVRTSAGLRPSPSQPLRAGDIAFAALLRAMRTASETDLSPGAQALARELVWCALTAARNNQIGQIIDAAHTLRLLAGTSVGDTPSDRIDHG
ncbi:hypothetical protein ACFVSK_11310 [Cellulosimicrobium cellulans]|uniref:hypothetical protein n=1 Tax=Cellulosimicrobium cellulans TaxID=1710 RepID=UPI0036F18628